MVVRPPDVHDSQQGPNREIRNRGPMQRRPLSSRTHPKGARSLGGSFRTSVPPRFPPSGVFVLGFLSELTICLPMIILLANRKLSNKAMYITPTPAPYVGLGQCIEYAIWSHAIHKNEPVINKVPTKYAKLTRLTIWFLWCVYAWPFRF